MSTKTGYSRGACVASWIAQVPPSEKPPIAQPLFGRADLQMSGDPVRHVDGQIRLHLAQA